MARPSQDISRITLLLQTRGVLGGRAIQEALGISPATLTRIVAKAGPAIERIGAARSSRYALRRTVRNLGSRWPLYRIREDGRPGAWAELRALHGGFRLIPQGAPPSWMSREYGDGTFPGLPFFLQDIRPQGYLGRAIARLSANRLATPSDVRLWNDDDVLSYFLTDGLDAPGDFVVGDHALELAMRAMDGVEANSIPETARAAAYPDRATAAQRGEVTGSSAGGEQPKFLATVKGVGGKLRSVIVKFSAKDPSPASDRWADLLVCEHLAAETLRARKIVAASTQVLRSGERTFLEIERFDRVAAIGRRGLLTLGAVEDAFLERSSPDWAAASRMLEEGMWISALESQALRWIWCFGDLIANSDMHRANASFWFSDSPPFRLTPFYDMLPMSYAPGSQGEIAERPFSPRSPTAGVIDVWQDAATAAVEFWKRVSSDPRISSSFQAVAGQNAGIVERQAARFE